MSSLSALKTPGRVRRLVFFIGVGVFKVAHLEVSFWSCPVFVGVHWKMRHLALEVVSTSENAFVMSRLRRDAPVLLGMMEIQVPLGLRFWM